MKCRLIPHLPSKRAYSEFYIVVPTDYDISYIQPPAKYVGLLRSLEFSIRLLLILLLLLLLLLLVYYYYC